MKYLIVSMNILALVSAKTSPTYQHQEEQQQQPQQQQLLSKTKTVLATPQQQQQQQQPLTKTKTVLATPHPHYFNPDHYLQSIDLHADLGEKFATFDPQQAVDHFFNFTGVATSPLGRVTSFFGDLAYPAILTGISVFVFYVAFQVLAHVLGLAYITKITLMNTAFTYLRSTQNYLLQRFVSVATDEAVAEAAATMDTDERARMASGFPSQKELWKLMTGVYKAINKYD